MDRPKLDSFDRSSLKSEAQRFFEKTAPVPHAVRALQSYSAISYGCWQIGNKFPMAPADLPAAAVGDGAMYKHGTCSQWHREVFTIRMLVISVGNGAINAPRYWQQRNERSRILATENERSTMLATEKWTLHDVGNREMNAPQYWQQRNESSTMLATEKWTLHHIGNRETNAPWCWQ